MVCQISNLWIQFSDFNPGVWPAFWTIGSGTWPYVSELCLNHVTPSNPSKNGEIDIIEGVHDNEHNQVTWHTAPGMLEANLSTLIKNSLLAQVVS